MNYYEHKKDLYNANRRLKRTEKHIEKKCIICDEIFYTGRLKKLTCCEECSDQHKSNLTLEKYYEKKGNNEQ